MTVDIRQGPHAGTKWPAELEEYTDPNTGAPVRRLTTYPGTANHHLYFTTDGWYDDGRRLLLRCRRDGRRNLFSVDLETGLITQLTDLPGEVYGSTRVNQETGEVYFAHTSSDGRYDNDHVLGLDLETLAVREVVRKPDGYENYGFGVDDVLADDERLLVSVGEHTDADGHQASHDEYPHSAIFVADIEGDNVELVHEEDYWISHVNASPTRPELVTYCHEGPWDHVDNRMHVIDVETGETYQLRSMADDEAVGHEYWLADGEHVGYHGWQGAPNNENCFHGTVRYDDTDNEETHIPVRRTHCHANTRDRFVCDGSDEKVSSVLLYERDEVTGEFGEPRKLATHAWENNGTHPHSRFSPDGSTVVFDADVDGESSDVYLVNVPEDVEELPVYEEP